jgi:hypothetical protein
LPGWIETAGLGGREVVIGNGRGSVVGGEVMGWGTVVGVVVIGWGTVVAVVVIGWGTVVAVVVIGWGTVVCGFAGVFVVETAGDSVV